MRNRRFISLKIIIGLLLVATLLTGNIFAMDDEASNPSSPIGVIDLEHIKTVAPRFIRLKTEAEAEQRELQEFIAQILTEHRRKITELTTGGTELETQHKALSSSRQEAFYLHTQELAAETQRQIDQKKQEIAQKQEEREAAVYEEFHAVLAKVSKDKGLECILLKGGFQLGGNDVTEQVLKTWKKWGLTFWQRVKLFFTRSTGESEQVEETTSEQEQ